MPFWFVLSFPSPFNQHSPDSLRVRGNHTTVPPPRELHPLCSHPAAQVVANVDLPARLRKVIEALSEHHRSNPESRPSSGNVRFLGVEVRSTSDSRRRWARSARTGYDPKATLPSLRRAQRADLREGIRFPNPRRGLPHSPQVLHLICESSGPFFKRSKKWQTSRATGHLFLLFFFLFSFFL